MLVFFWTKNHDFMSKKKTLTSTFFKNPFFLKWKEYSAKIGVNPLETFFFKYRVVDLRSGLRSKSWVLIGFWRNYPTNYFYNQYYKIFQLLMKWSKNTSKINTPFWENVMKKNGRSILPKYA